MAAGCRGWRPGAEFFGQPIKKTSFYSFIFQLCSFCSSQPHQKSTNTIEVLSLSYYGVSHSLQKFRKVLSQVSLKRECCVFPNRSAIGRRLLCLAHLRRFTPPPQWQLSCTLCPARTIHRRACAGRVLEVISCCHGWLKIRQKFG